jgi:hypothetical protein
VIMIRCCVDRVPSRLPLRCKRPQNWRHINRG